MIYDRSFLSEDESRAVILEYLRDKWGAQMASEDNDWTRVGLLPNPPERVNDTCPLSDQTNKGHWTKIEELSDEFGETSLDASKWQPKYPGFRGRAPSRFSPENITVGGGQLHLVMCKSSPTNISEKAEAIQYMSAVVDSTHLAFYGYYEVMARAMNSAGSSSFWFHRSETPHEKNEIDVFEIGGKSPGFDRKLNMNLHVWETPTETRHWNIGSSWIAPWRFADAFHVFGLEWSENEIKYYVDGVIVRRVKNTNWHVPLHMNFDSETMPTWFGLPADTKTCLPPSALNMCGALAALIVIDRRMALSRFKVDSIPMTLSLNINSYLRPIFESRSRRQRICSRPNLRRGIGELCRIHPLSAALDSRPCAA